MAILGGNSINFAPPTGQGYRTGSEIMDDIYTGKIESFEVGVGDAGNTAWAKKLEQAKVSKKAIAAEDGGAHGAGLYDSMKIHGAQSPVQMILPATAVPQVPGQRPILNMFSTEKSTLVEGHHRVAVADALERETGRQQFIPVTHSTTRSRELRVWPDDTPPTTLQQVGKPTHLRTTVESKRGLWEGVPGETYHGSKGAVSKFVAGGGIDPKDLLFGAGIYTTDTPRVSQAYANLLEKPGKAYRVEHQGPQKIMDLMKPQEDMREILGSQISEMSKNVRTRKEYLRGQVGPSRGGGYPVFPGIQEAETSLYEMGRDFKAYPEDSAEKMYTTLQKESRKIQTSLGDDIFGPVGFETQTTNALKEKGYTTLTHRGGQRVGGIGEHDVSIFLHPERVDIAEDITNQIYSGSRATNVTDRGLETLHKSFGPERNRKILQASNDRYTKATGVHMPPVPFVDTAPTHTKTILRAGIRESEVAASTGGREVARSVAKIARHESGEGLVKALNTARRIIGRV